MRTVATCALLACLAVGAQSACGRTIDLRTAGDAATSAAATHGQVERVDCWRPTGQLHTRPRSAAFCVARVRTASAEGCFLFYELRFANERDRAVKVTRSWRPWCASPRPQAQNASRRRRRAAALVREAAATYGEVERISCTRARRASGRPIKGLVLCAAWLRSWPRCGVLYEVRRGPGGPSVVATYAPWCAEVPHWA
jgi:hypothetical protein